MSKVEKLQSMLVKSQKNKDADVVLTLRLLLSEIKNFAIEQKKDFTKLSDNEVDTVLSKQAKQRKDSIDAFSKASREDLVAKEQSELDIISSFLPQKLSLDDTVKAVDKAIAVVKPKDRSQMGNVMTYLKQEYGSTLDMGEASKIVAQKLT